MTLPIIDLVFFVIVAACAVIALLKGFINEIFKFGSPVIAIWLAIILHKYLVPYVEKYVNIRFVPVIISFVLIFIIAFLLLNIIKIILGNVVNNPVLKPVDRFLGLVFGVAEGLAIVAIILIILTAQPWFDVSRLISGSFFYNLLDPFISGTSRMINSSGAVIQ